jgi:hypothetical protein
VPTDSFNSSFQQATKSKAYPKGKFPYPYQERLAAVPIASRLIHIPTGCGGEREVEGFEVTYRQTVLLAYLSPHTPLKNNLHY